MTPYINYLKRASWLLFCVMAMELMLGGGGRLTAFVSVSLRMILFACALLVSFTHIIAGAKLPKLFLYLMVSFAGMLTVSVLIGYFHNSKTSLIWEDVKPLLYFFLLPFVYFTLESEKKLLRFSKLIIAAGLILSFSFLFTLTMIHSGLIPFLDFYELVLNTGEFFFRGELTFFYKGFIYLCVAFIFLWATDGKVWMKLVVGLAILLTVTRGFWVATAVAMAVYFFYSDSSPKRYWKVAICLAISVSIVTSGNEWIAQMSRTIDRVQTTSDPKSVDEAAKPWLLGDRLHSDRVRGRQLNEVLEQVTGASAIVGHGFGQGTPTRPVHMEIAYLEIFHKQGIVGLAVWSALFFVIARNFLKSRRGRIELALFCSVILVAVESFTNQFINNPIGLFIILVALVGLRVSAGNRVSAVN